MATVIQVEQKWKFSKNSVAWYQITRIDGDSAWGWDGWECISEAPPKASKPTHSPVKATQLPDELDFFKRSTTPGNCPCGMIRSECSYHKD
jgi:hypothetical protein